MIKKCSKCGLEKEVGDNFTKNLRCTGGFDAWCRECHKVASNTHRQKQAASDPDYYKNNALRKHKLNIGSYEEKLKLQDGHCALCLATNTNGQRLSVDHDHTCCNGKYSCKECHRGLLCGSCNARLGYVEQLIKEFTSFTVIPDSWTARALSYLASYKPRADSEKLDPAFGTNIREAVAVVKSMFAKV